MSQPVHRTLPATLVVGGLVLIVAGTWFYRLYAGDAQTIAVVTILLGAACAMAGLTSGGFLLASRRAYEWLVAWRYLRSGSSSHSWILAICGLGLLVVGLGLQLWLRNADPELFGSRSAAESIILGLRIVIGASYAVGGLICLFGVLHQAFSVFTCVSILGVTLGTALLVVVLSVMGGFEGDLRRKILGTLSHVIVTKPKQMFADYRQVKARLTRLEDVRAISPYLESEVMIASEANHGGVLLRGIIPDDLARVTDIERYLDNKRGAGSLENLTRPDLLAKLAAIPFRADAGTAVSEPMGVGRGSGPGSGRAESKREKAAAKSDGPGVLAGAQPVSPAKLAELEARVKDLLAARPPPTDERPVYPGIIVGAELANNLRLYVGDDVTLVSPLGGMSPAGPIPKTRPFRVAGIFHSGMYEYDTKLAYVTLQQAQRFVGVDDEVTGLEIRAMSTERAIEMAATVRVSLGSVFQVRDWQQLNRSLFAALKLEKIVMFLFLVFIVGVASLSIVTTLIMVVLQKRREVAVLKAVGASQWSILRVFLFAGTYIGVVGTSIGVLIGVSTCVLVSQVGLPFPAELAEVFYTSRLPVEMSVTDIALVGFSAVVLSLVATLYPALQAMRLNPVVGLRGEG